TIQWSDGCWVCPVSPISPPSAARSPVPTPTARTKAAASFAPWSSIDCAWRASGESRWTSTARSNPPAAPLKAPPSGSTRSARAIAPTIRCSAPSLRPARYSTSSIARATSTIPSAPVPSSWPASARCARRFPFLFVRHEVKIRDKEPVQLDLFVPTLSGFDFKVIVTNKRARPKKVLAFHNGRGAQEAVFAELKSQCQMDYVPVRTHVGNQLYLCSAILAHNLARELQMQAEPAPHRT